MPFEIIICKKNVQIEVQILKIEWAYDSAKPRQNPWSLASAGVAVDPDPVATGKAATVL